MPKTLLVDTNRASYPTYQALLAEGHEVWIVGGRPDEPLARLAKNFQQLDYSDAGKLAAFVEEKGFDFLVPGCTDLSYEVCAQINADRFPGIDSVEVTSAINTKSQFRALAGKLQLSVPKVVSLEEASSLEAVIIKPVDSFSGRGMTVLRTPNKEEITKAYEKACEASKTGTAMVEEFVEGQLYSHSAFLKDGEVEIDFVVREDCSTNPFTVDTSYVDFSFSDEIRESLRSDVSRLADELGLSNGLIHTQFIVSGERYWLIETTRRCPGDIYSLLIEYSTGYPYALAYAAPFIGLPQVVSGGELSQERIIRHTSTSKDGESLWGFQFSCPLDIRLFVPLCPSGEYIDPSPYGRASVFFIRAATKNDQDTIYKQLLAGELYRLG